VFYPVVEEYLMQNRQHELPQELELKRQLRDSLKSKSDKRLRFFAITSDLLRNLVRVFRAETAVTFEDETSLDCVAC